MGMQDDETSGTPSVKPRNWWKIGFFIALFAFELTREIAVLASTADARPNSLMHLFAYDGHVTAQGSWKRIDGGGKLVPSAVTIECDKDTGRCLEASTSMNEMYVYAPEIDWFNAQFSADAVTYENDLPDCARYSVRLDLKLKKVFAVRDRKENPSNPNCKMLEKRIEMQLGDGFEPGQPSLADHFVPIIGLVAAAAKIV